MDVERATTGGWNTLHRERFASRWASLPRLTVLATMPGWGRTTWMRQCHAYRAATDLAHWLTDRTAVERFLAAPHGDERTVTLYIDDVIDSAADPLWAPLVARVTGSGLRAVVSSIDGPPRVVADRADAIELDERHMAFDAEEVIALVALNGIEPPPDLLAPLTTVYRGCPVLVQRRLAHFREHTRRGTWTSPGTPLDASVVADLGTALVARREATTFFGLLDQARDLRRFSSDMLERATDPRVAAAWFDRLRAAPFGTIDVDADTGHEVFEWSTSAWQELERRVPPDERAARTRRALETTTAAGHHGMALYYLLRLDDLAGAEQVVFDDFRLFLLTTSRVTYEALRAVPPDRLADCPNLSLLLGELLVRDTGDAAIAAPHHHRALQALARADAGTRFDGFRLACRQLFGLVSLGERARTVALLAEVESMLDPDGAAGVLDEAMANPADAPRISPELFLPFWAATQVDAHDAALRLAGIMRTHLDPSSPTAIPERLTALTEEVFAGLHLAGGDRDDGGVGHTDCFVLLESGHDDEALEFIQMLASRIGTSAARSSSEALILLVRALVAPDALGRADVASTVGRSTRFWTDGQASTFVLLAAVFASLAVGDPETATRAARDAGQRDWFALVATALVALHDDEAGAAMDALNDAERAWRCPRALAVTGTLTAVAHQRLGNVGAAIARLEDTHARCPSDLVRFALRAVTLDDLAQLTEHGDALPTQLLETLAASARDPHPLRRTTPLRVTRAERELLVLMREGMTNPQIAAARYVSINTVRTQIRLLLRKLDVANRTEAVERAERLGLFDP